MKDLLLPNLPWDLVKEDESNNYEGSFPSPNVKYGDRGLYIFPELIQETATLLLERTQKKIRELEAELLRQKNNSGINLEDQRLYTGLVRVSGKLLKMIKTKTFIPQAVGREFYDTYRQLENQRGYFKPSGLTL